MEENQKDKREEVKKNRERLYKEKQELQKLYQYLVTELKILSRRADYKNDKNTAERYRSAFEKLELIRERRHLTEIGKDGEHKEAYMTALKIVKETYQAGGKTVEALEDAVSEIEELCRKFSIEEKEPDQRKDNQGFER